MSLALAAIVLASASASRGAMLDAAGVSYSAAPSGIDERAIEAEMVGSDPAEIAQALASGAHIAIRRRCEPGPEGIGAEPAFRFSGEGHVPAAPEAEMPRPGHQPEKAAEKHRPEHDPRQIGCGKQP